eukprot:UN06471
MYPKTEEHSATSSSSQVGSTGIGQDGGNTTTNANLSVLEQTLQTSSLILQNAWVMEKREYPDLVFPLDELTRKSKASKLLAAV